MICSKCEYDDEDVGLFGMRAWVKKDVSDIICQNCVDDTKGYIGCHTCPNAGHKRFFKNMGLLQHKYPNGVIDYFEAWQCQTCYEGKVPLEDDE